MNDELYETLRQARALLSFQGELGLRGLDVTLDPGSKRFSLPAGTAPSARAEASRMGAPLSAAPAARFETRAPARNGPALAPALESIRADIGDCTRCKLH